MTNVEAVGSSVTGAFEKTSSYVGSVLPTVLAAVLILVVGWVLADWIGRAVRNVLRGLKLDEMLNRLGFGKMLQTARVQLEVSRALGWLVTWFLYAVVLVTTADILGLDQISRFLNEVVLYIPNVIIAVVIVVVGIVIGGFLKTLVLETTRAASIAAGQTLSRLAQWAVVIFALMAALVQLHVAAELIQILFTGFVLMISLAGGIAFGLGGKDKAKDVIEQLFRRE